MIHWNILSGIKNFHIYDPFGVINKENIKTLTQSICNIYNQNFSLLIITEELIYDCRKQEKIELKDLKENSYTIIISIINFKNSNEELILKLFNSNYSNFSFLPKQLDYFKNEKNIKSFDIFYNTDNEDNNTNFTKFYTKKNADYLPELILCFSDEREICLYGYPFTMLENSELIRAGKFHSLNVIKFLEYFERYSKIEKRFGK